MPGDWKEVWADLRHKRALMILAAVALLVFMMVALVVWHNPSKYNSSTDSKPSTVPSTSPSSAPASAPSTTSPATTPSNTSTGATPVP